MTGNVPTETIAYRVAEAERDIAKTNDRLDGLEGKLNAILLAVIGLALSIASSAVVFAITILATRGGG